MGADGASAVIVCETEKAKKLVKKPIEVVGVSSATSPGKQFTELPLECDRRMFKEAYDMAGIKDPYHEVEYMGIHDCPATMIVLAAEAAGYFKPGETWKFMRDGRMNFDQDKPVSTSGGRTQSGHPRAPAFGIEVAEAVYQMRGENGVRQMIKSPKTSVVWGGGSGYSHSVCVLRTL
jgi:acetyl-CoA C-acetyltransferase